MDDLKMEIIETRDDARPTRGGEVEEFKLVRFYLGKHGPFVERFTRDEFNTPGIVAARAEGIRATLRSII